MANAEDGEHLDKMRHFVRVFVGPCEIRRLNQALGLYEFLNERIILLTFLSIKTGHFGTQKV